MKTNSIALTALLEIADDETGWNSKINHFVKKRTDKEEWAKINGDYVVSGDKAIEFIMQLGHKDFKRNRTMRELKKKIKQLTAKNSQLVNNIVKIEDEAKNKENEFQEFFDFESWDKMNKKILELFVKVKDFDSAIFAVTQTIMMVGYNATYATTRTRLTKIRTLIDESQIKDELKEVILKFLVMPLPINDKINERVEKSNTDRIKKTDNIKTAKVTDIRRMISFLEEDITTKANSDDKIQHGEKMRYVTYCTIYLGLATGRRPHELLKGTFKKIRGKSNFIMFGGQAKKKTIVADDYEIPLLFTDSYSVVKALELLREMIPTAIERLDNSRLTDRMGAMYRKDWELIMRKFNLTIGVDDGNIKADKMKNARSAYAVTCEKLLNQTSQNRLAQAGYMSLILGHMDWDTSTYQSYYRFNPSLARFGVKKYLRDFYTHNEMDLTNIDI